MTKRSGPTKREQELLAIITRLEARIVELEKRNAELVDQLAKFSKNSSNSSKKPSSDIVKPPKPAPPSGEGGRTRGGQPGHTKYERRAFALDEIKETHNYYLEACPHCGGPLFEAAGRARMIDQIEVEPRPVRIDRYQALGYWCPRCGKIHYAPFPSEVRKGGLAGVRLTALIGYMKGVCHASFSTIRKYLRDVLGVDISRGQLRKIVGKVSEALEQPWLELLGRLPDEKAIHVDETGHKDNGDRFWTWCFRARDYTVFKIADNRASRTLTEILGEEFAGVIGCDYFSAYRKFMREFDVLVQFCLAHLIRDLKFLCDYPEKQTKEYGGRVLEAVRRMFAHIHRREEMDAAAFQAALEEHRQNILATALTDVPDKCHVLPIAKRFRDHGEAYFRFITTPDIEPTNNLAEQAIRFVVIDRRITQGTRSEGGRQWCERIWTIIATCVAQSRSVFDFILEAVQAHFKRIQPPSLLNSP
ncbi:MAG: IS66 family transposase [Proteobacteria bacterium]|nr:IS66 family transposase [Pseudomonadota bacterium]